MNGITVVPASEAMELFVKREKAYSDEETLLAGARAGEEAALKILHDRHSEDLFRVAYRLLLSPPDAEDVVQDVFVALPEALKTFEGRGSIEGWLARVTTRTALMKIRRRKLRAEVSFGGVLAFISGYRPPPVVERIQVERMLARLPEHERVVVVLHEIEGFTHPQIAETLGISEVASRGRLHRAMKRLRKLADQTE